MTYNAGDMQELQTHLQQVMARERARGVADAIRVIKAMGHDWPDAICQHSRGMVPYSVADEYGDQFVSRILQSFPEAAVHVPFGSRRKSAVPEPPAAPDPGDWMNY